MARVDGQNLIEILPNRTTSYTSQGYTVLVAESDGLIRDGTLQGLFVHQTRLLSRLRYLVDGEPPFAVVSSNVEQHAWLGYYIAVPPGIDPGPADTGSGQVQHASQHSLELRVSRQVGSGVHEDLYLTNFTQQPTSFEFAVELDADFADQTESDGGVRRQEGHITREWAQQPGADVWELTFDYHAQHDYDHQGSRGTAEIHRKLVYRVMEASSPPAYADGRITFRVELAPHGSWQACINMIPWIDGEEMHPQYQSHAFEDVQSEMDRRRELFLRESTGFHTPHSDTLSPVVIRALNQARRDLASLRLHKHDQHERAWTVAAGLPLYIALFGRDTLTVAWQTGLLSQDIARGTLPVLAALQGEEIDDWRDEQPGRMLHEAHTGPLAALNYNPRRRYYGSMTTSGFYPVALANLWHWTGDREAVAPYIEPALRALRWLDAYGDLDGDGFYEYKTRSEQGVKHQAWKDSGDAIVYADGSQVEPPIATCEEQGFVYQSKLFMAGVLWWFDRHEEAERLIVEARELKERFNEAFWMEDEGFVALGLDAQNRPIKAITSNPGHCVATGIIHDVHVEQTCRRLMADDLFSGWGIRTLSAENPAYNPYSYHRGTVWPVEQGTFALGFTRYGLAGHMHRLTRAQFEAASLFEFCRLPEVFSGHPRDDDHPFPAIYSQTNSPQAWSASAIFLMLQALLSLYPYAPLNTLIVDPHLPDWLPEITLTRLRVGEALADIRFYRREDGKTAYDVLDVEGTLHVVRQPMPWSLTASFGQRVVDLITSLLPGS